LIELVFNLIDAALLSFGAYKFIFFEIIIQTKKQKAVPKLIGTAFSH
jgi:hypothetical protein